jgi:outer membrane protein assembly factor BamE (lipoprotein component of BamABCDE complex)
MLLRMRRVLLPLLLLAACSTVSPTKPPDRTPEQQQNVEESIARGEVRMGMVKDEVRRAMGKPNRTSKTTYGRKPATCWSYIYTDIYFDDDGYVIGWQSATG